MTRPPARGNIQITNMHQRLAVEPAAGPTRATLLQPQVDCRRTRRQSPEPAHHVVLWQLHPHGRISTALRRPAGPDELGGGKSSYSPANPMRVARCSGTIGYASDACATGLMACRAINCYAPANNNTCGGKDVEKAQRKAWYDQLKAQSGATGLGEKPGAFTGDDLAKDFCARPQCCSSRCWRHLDSSSAIPISSPPVRRLLAMGRACAHYRTRFRQDHIALSAARLKSDPMIQVKIVVEARRGQRLPHPQALWLVYRVRSIDWTPAIFAAVEAFAGLPVARKVDGSSAFRSTLTPQRVA